MTRAASRRPARRRPASRLLASATTALLLAALALLPSPGAGGAEERNIWLDRRVLDIAHAGGEDEAPHSAMFTFKRAAALGAEVLEGDVRLTADGVLVVHHDATVDATTNGTGRVDEKTYAELFALDHGYKFTPYRWSCGDCPEDDYVYRGIRDGLKPPPAGYTADDFTIPTAESMFTTFPDSFLDLEIKESGQAARDAADALIALVKEHDAADRTIFVSFDDEIVQYVRDRFPEAITSPGLDGVTEFFLTRQPQPQHAILQVPPTYGEIQVVDEKFVDDAHAAGLAVWVWMDTKEQESEAFYQQLLDWGVDGILGARPQLARDLIDANGLTWQGDPEPSTTTTSSTTTSTPTTSSTTTSTTAAAGSPAATATPRATTATPRFTG